MKSLGEIYWDIDHECLHSDKTISFSDETMMLFHAAEEYVEELRKHDGRWKSIVLHDIDYLKASSFIRREQKGYSEGAEMFLDFVCQELERYGFKIDDGDISSVKETNQPKNIPETGENTDANGEDVEHDNNYPDIPKELKELFPNESQCVNFVKRNYGKTAAVVAYAYKDEPGIIDPSDSDNSIPVRAILFRYFVEPFIKGETKKKSARTGFYRYFQIK